LLHHFSPRGLEQERTPAPCRGAGGTAGALPRPSGMRAAALSKHGAPLRARVFLEPALECHLHGLQPQNGLDKERGDAYWERTRNQSHVGSSLIQKITSAEEMSSQSDFFWVGTKSNGAEKSKRV